MITVLTLHQRSNKLDYSVPNIAVIDDDGNLPGLAADDPPLPPVLIAVQDHSFKFAPALGAANTSLLGGAAYQVQGHAIGENWNNLETLPAFSSGFTTVTKEHQAVPWYYRVIAWNDNGDSRPSNVILVSAAAGSGSGS